MYYLKSVLSEKPFYGQLCNSLNDIKVGNCTEEKSMFGGDPGAFEQLVAKKIIRELDENNKKNHFRRPGVYYINITTGSEDFD